MTNRDDTRSTELKLEWPYPVQYEKENRLEADVLVLGGGIAGCHAAINAARRGAKVVVVDKGAVRRSGSGGAGVHGRVNIMLPMITSLEEVRLAKEYFLEMRDDIRKKYGTPNGEHIKLGIMIEVPAAAWDIENIALETDFISIGTNDLIQYILAVDRNNARVAGLYQPLSPAVLKVIHRVICVASEVGKKVSICGEMAHEKHYLPFLLGIGARSLSIDPQFLPEVQQAIADIDILTAQAHAQKLLELASTKQIEAELASMD